MNAYTKIGCFVCKQKCYSHRIRKGIVYILLFSIGQMKHKYDDTFTFYTTKSKNYQLYLSVIRIIMRTTKIFKLKIRYAHELCNKLQQKFILQNNQLKQIFIFQIEIFFPELRNVKSINHISVVFHPIKARVLLNILSMITK